MTREEFNRKAEAGTLTVGEVLRNREYATAEQLAALTGEAVHVDTEPLHKLTAAARSVVEGFAVVEQVSTEAAVALWAELAEELHEQHQDTEQ